jgi:hypothetical protein
MVSKITFFEPHFDGAQFGPATRPSDEPAVEADTPDADIAGEVETRRRPLGRTVTIAVGIATGLLIGMMAIRWSKARDSKPVDIEEASTSAPAVEE